MSKLENFCRICLEYCELKSSISIFEPCWVYNKTYQYLLEECTSYKIKIFSNGAEIICSSCANLIQCYYSFRLQVIESDKAIHNPILVEIKQENVDSADADQRNPKKYCEDSMVEVPLPYFEPKYELEVVDDSLVPLLVHADEAPSFVPDNTGGPPFPILEDPDDSPVPALVVEKLEIDEEVKVTTEADGQHEYQCKYCEDQFSSKTDLRSHECLKFDCPICVERFDTNYKLKKHTEKNHPNNCEYCNKSFNCDETLRIHLQDHTGEKPFVCSYCGKGYKGKLRLKSHLKIHKPGIHKCVECDETFHYETALADHINKHLGLGPAKKHLCTICNKGFSENRDRKRHEEIHNTVLKYQCEICGKKFRSKQVYHSHKRNQHPSVIREFLCSQCPQKLRTKNKLWAHEQIHRDPNSFVCSICGKTFGYKSLLRTHYQRYHPVTRVLLKCDLCPKLFNTKSKLDLHKRYHSDETPYPCTECHRKFKIKSDRKNHMKKAHLVINN